MSASDGSNNKKITFEEIAPDWSKRLNKLTTAKGISYEKILYTLISVTTRNVLLEKQMDIVHRTFFMEPLTIV